MKKLTIKIRGSVQGVGFRYEAKMVADRLGLTGFARNEQDGSVYIEAEGEKEKLDEFLKWCHEGPDSAEITGLDFDFSDATGNYNNFVVK